MPYVLEQLKPDENAIRLGRQLTLKYQCGHCKMLLADFDLFGFSFAEVSSEVEALLGDRLVHPFTSFVACR